MRTNRYAMVIAIVLLWAASAEAGWQTKAMWCASDMAVSQGGNVVTALQDHSNSHGRYCEACASGKDQYDSLLACFDPKNDKWTEIRKEIEEAGREKVNAFMDPKTPSCCKEDN